MSTFRGPLEEVDLVSVDRFYNLNSTVYFLSHHHADHMEGLRNCMFARRLREFDDIFLYCSPLTKLWLSLDLPNLGHKIQALPINSEVKIKIPELPPGRDPYLQVTTLPAGHCPGSVMFLFNWESKNILYTGDIRMRLQDLERMDPLRNISLDTLYLDTTFYSPFYGYLPSRKRSIDTLVKFCQDWLSLNEENIIDIRRPAGIGIESVYIDLYEKLGIRIHVTQEEWNQYGRIPDIARALTCDKNVKARIHACVKWVLHLSKKLSSKFHRIPTVVCTRCSLPAYLSREKGALLKHHDQIPGNRVRSIKLYALSARYLRETDDIMSYDDANNLYKLVYSSHCSHSELRDIVSYLSPKKLVPCVVHNVSPQEIIDALRPNSSPASTRTSSFESTFDLSPKAKSGQDDPAQNCSQTSVTSISSIEESSPQKKAASGGRSKRYEVPDSSDDDDNVTLSQSERSDGRCAGLDDSPEKRPWADYMEPSKKLRWS